MWIFSANAHNMHIHIELKRKKNLRVYGKNKRRKPLYSFWKERKKIRRSNLKKIKIDKTINWRRGPTPRIVQHMLYLSLSSVCIVYFQLWHPFEHVKLKAILAYGFYYKQFSFVYRYGDIWLLFSTFFSLFKTVQQQFRPKNASFFLLSYAMLRIFFITFCMILKLVLIRRE